MKETDLIKKAIEELKKFGYVDNQILTAFSIQERYRADIVVLHENKPYLIIEVKTGSINATFDVDSYKFDPLVRQVQSYANVSQAQYFAIYNGENIFWFTSDPAGRPQFLEQPVVPPINTVNLKLEKTQIKRLLNDIRNHALHFSRLSSFSQLGIIFYAQIQEELGNPELKADLLSGQRSDLQHDGLDDYLTGPDEQLLSELFQKISRLRFTELNPQSLLLAIDEVFNEPKRSIQIPRWLADLMVKTASITSQDIVLDLSYNYNTIIPAVLKNVTELNTDQLSGTFSFDTSEYWSRFQELLLRKKEVKHYRISNVNPVGKSQLKGKNYTKIFIAPIFGSKFSIVSEISGQLITDDLEILLEDSLIVSSQSAIITFLAPETFLFADRFKKSRKTLERFGTIRSLISLPPKTFHPSVSVKTSIVVFQKGFQTPTSIFVGKIENTPVNDTLNCLDFEPINELVQYYHNWLKGDEFNQNPNNYLIEQNQITFSNLAKVYLNEEYSERPDSSVETLPLTSVCTLIKKGTFLKLSSAGTIPVIGPSSIRELSIEEKALGLTDDVISANAVNVRVGDIVLNAISTYRGAAALVNEQLKGLVISQHVILIRPDEQKIDAEYLASILNSNLIKKQMSQITSGTVVSFIPIGLLKELLIPVPSLEKQKAFAEKVKNAQGKVAEAEKNLASAKNFFKQLIDDVKIGGGQL